MPNKNLIAGPLSMINLSDSPNTYGYVIMPMTCAQRCALLLGGNFFLLESLYWCELGAHAKFRNPKTTTYGILVTAKKKSGRKIRKIVALATYFAGTN
jgi:hypothetical protein